MSSRLLKLFAVIIPSIFIVYGCIEDLEVDALTLMIAGSILCGIGLYAIGYALFTSFVMTGSEWALAVAVVGYGGYLAATGEYPNLSFSRGDGEDIRDFGYEGGSENPPENEFGDDPLIQQSKYQFSSTHNNEYIPGPGSELNTEITASVGDIITFHFLAFSWDNDNEPTWTFYVDDIYEEGSALTRSAQESESHDLTWTFGIQEVLAGRIAIPFFIDQRYEGHQLEFGLTASDAEDVVIWDTGEGFYEPWGFDENEPLQVEVMYNTGLTPHQIQEAQLIDHDGDGIFSVIESWQGIQANHDEVQHIFWNDSTTSMITAYELPYEDKGVALHVTKYGNQFKWLDGSGASFYHPFDEYQPGDKDYNLNHPQQWEENHSFTYSQVGVRSYSHALLINGVRLPDNTFGLHDGGQRSIDANHLFNWLHLTIAQYMVNFATHWMLEEDMYLASNNGHPLPLCYNDGSFKYGGEVPGHSGHETGLELDIFNYPSERWPAIGPFDDESQQTDALETIALWVRMIDYSETLINEDESKYWMDPRTRLVENTCWDPNLRGHQSPYGIRKIITSHNDIVEVGRLNNGDVSEIEGLPDIVRELHERMRYVRVVEAAGHGHHFHVSFFYPEWDQTFNSAFNQQSYRDKFWLVDDQHLYPGETIP